MKHEAKNGTWHIEYNPKPIPLSMHDYDFRHEDYDGPPDNRCGTGCSVIDCVEKIEEMYQS